MDNLVTNTTSGKLDAPPDWDHSEVSIDSLYVTKGTLGKHEIFATYWKPTEEELRLIAAGGVFEIICLATQPPMQVGIIDIPMIKPEDIQQAVEMPQ